MPWWVFAFLSVLSFYLLFFSMLDCTQCVSSEMTLVQKIGQERANELFKEHWESWFTQVSTRICSSSTPCVLFV